MKKINKPNEVNDVLSLKKDDNIVIVRKDNTKNIIGSFYFTNWTDMKNMKAFIKNVEKQVRNSKEYKYYLGHLNNELGIHSCSVFGNINDDIEGITLEYHHYPFTLYDIVEIVINRYILNDEDFTSLDVARAVLKLHESNKVGLVKLSKTAHDLVHAGKIYINPKSIFGDVKSFVDEYVDYIPDDIKENYNKLLDMKDSSFDETIITT